MSSNRMIDRVVKRCFSGTQGDFQRWFYQQATGDKDGLQMVFTPNPEQVVLASESEEFGLCLLQADRMIVDGVGLALVAGWRSLSGAGASEGDGKGKKISRITGVDTLSWWLEIAAREKISTLLVGGRGGVAQLLAKQVDPQAQWCHGVEGHANAAAARHPDYQEQTKSEEEQLYKLIRKYKPRVVFVAFGAPWQEEFLCRHKETLEKYGVRVAMVCGGAFDYLTGVVPRAPRWIRALGLEWLYRLVKEPWRWRRQLRLIRFLRLVVGR